MNRIRSHDQGFVAAPPEKVYGVLASPETYPRWWPGARASGDHVEAPAPGGRASLGGHREGVGLYLSAMDSSLEWYLEPFEEGTIVNAFLELPADGSRRRTARNLLRRRTAVRRGLTGLKLSLEAER